MFYNNYPSFTDTNNLSLLIFLDIGNVSFVLPGDLEEQGWRQLLQNSDVCELLGRVNIFVASHHGRESGYCKEVFDYCSPRYVIMSDGPVQYGTQKMANVYGQHASGGLFKGQRRKVLSTRNDGNILWSLDLTGKIGCILNFRIGSMSDMEKQAGIYARYSPGRDRDQTSTIEAQVAMCREKAQREGVAIESQSYLR